MVRYLHTNIVVQDVERIATFYEEALGCVRTWPSETLSGDALNRGIGVAEAEIRAVWLQLPGFDKDGPVLELFQYIRDHDRPARLPNQRGFNHIAFEVDDVRATLDAALAAGGSLLGEVVEFEHSGGILTFVYLRDPEGNIVELEQSEN